MYVLPPVTHFVSCHVTSLIYYVFSFSLECDRSFSPYPKLLLSNHSNTYSPPTPVWCLLVCHSRSICHLVSLIRLWASSSGISLQRPPCQSNYPRVISVPNLCYLYSIHPDQQGLTLTSIHSPTEISTMATTIWHPPYTSKRVNITWLSAPYGMPQRPWWTLQVTVATCVLENQPYTKYCPSVARVTNKKKLQTQIVNWWSHWPIIDGNATWTAKVTKQNKTPKKAKKQSHSLPKKQQNKQVIQVGTDCASLSSQAGHEVKVQSSFPKKAMELACDSSGHRVCISILSSRPKKVRSQSSIQVVSPKKQQNKQVIQVGTDCASLSSQAGQAVKVQSNGFPQKTTEQASNSSGHRLCISILSSRSRSQSSIQRFPQKKQQKK